MHEMTLNSNTPKLEVMAERLIVVPSPLITTVNTLAQCVTREMGVKNSYKELIYPNWTLVDMRGPVAEVDLTQKWLISAFYRTQPGVIQKLRDLRVRTRQPEAFHLGVRSLREIIKAVGPADNEGIVVLADRDSIDRIMFNKKDTDTGKLAVNGMAYILRKPRRVSNQTGRSFDPHFGGYWELVKPSLVSIKS